MAEKYWLTLTAEEREPLIQLTTSGTAAAAKLRHARILLQAAASALGPGCSDTESASGCEVSLATSACVRKAFVEQGLTAAVERQRPRGRVDRQRDGAQEAQLSAVACSAPPAGQARWTRKLLADRLVEPEVVEAVSAETVRRTLKKPPSSPG